MKQVSQTARWMTFLVFLNLLIALCGAMGIVWIRVQIRKAADRIESSERELADLSRRIQQMDTKIAAAHQPDNLVARIGDRLQRPERSQIVWYRPPSARGGELAPGIAFTEDVGVAGIFETENAN